MKKSFICLTCKKSFVDNNYKNGRKYCSRECFKKSRLTPISERFEKYIIPEPNSGCWLWIGSYSGSGYGVLYTKRRAVYAHRISWEFYIGPIPNGLDVLHKCDNPPCVNPTHLFLGTQTDNNIDRDFKGRNNGIFTKEQVRIIRCDNRTEAAIATEYGVSNSVVHNIKARNRYRWVD